MKRTEIRKLDALWAIVVKEIAGYRCEYCGVLGRMEAAHVVGRRHRATRWGVSTLELIGLDPEYLTNAMIHFKYDLCGHCLCHRCHQEYDEHGPLEPGVISNVVGKERKSLLQRYAKTTVAKYQDYEEIKGVLEKIGEQNEEMKDPNYPSPPAPS